MRKLSGAIVIDKSMKIRLLKAIQAGELLPEDFPEFKIDKNGFFELMKQALTEDKK